MIPVTITIRKARWRAHIALVMVLALTLRGFIPAGYMPTTTPTTDGHKVFAITICSGGNGPQTVYLDENNRKFSADQTEHPAHGLAEHSKAPCVFSINASFADNTATPAAITIHIGTVLQVFAWNEDFLGRPLYYGNSGPRAPPTLS